MTPITSLQSSDDIKLSRSALKKAGEASTQFESVLLGQWLQQAESSFGSVPGDEDEDAGAGELKEFAMQHLAAAITKSGGIGIAKMVDRALTRNAGANEAGTERTSHSSNTPQLLVSPITLNRNLEAADGTR